MLILRHVTVLSKAYEFFILSLWANMSQNNTCPFNKSLYNQFMSVCN